MNRKKRKKKNGKEIELLKEKKSIWYIITIILVTRIIDISNKLIIKLRNPIKRYNKQKNMWCIINEKYNVKNWNCYWRKDKREIEQKRKKNEK